MKDQNPTDVTPVSTGIEQAAAVGTQKIDMNDLEKVDIENEQEWWDDPVTASYGAQASFKMAQFVMWIFAGVYVLSFVFAFMMFTVKDATFDGMIELLKFLLGSIIPLVTLAVGYYLGDRNSNG